MTSGTSKQSIFNNNNNNNNNAANKNQPTSLPSTLKSSSSSPSDNKFEGISAANNPAPRLPSRPVSKAGRRSRSSKTTAWTSPDPVTTTSAKLSPDTKPKPTQLATIVNSSPSQRSKGRSVSNPPPIQPKPFISKFNNSKPDVPNQSKPDGIQKPPPAPATASKTTPAVPLRQVAARREQWQRLPDNNKTSDNDNDDNESTNVKPSEILMRTRSKSNGWTQPTQKNAPPVLPARNIAPKVEAAVGIAAAKKTPPPPPPSRPVQSGPKVPARYEELFSAIHDEGYVDGPTAKVIWKRSKVTDEALAKIWQQCDPQGSGLLDKNAFIQGMREIDALLGQQPSK
ncbi:hypothetical protein BDB00DRAFT_794463 [Zychaea mexicana]|uniref:uncharacterized protein n=1 Tax=Zychaea mexicana TaxID=64656 RepID=UPI0022FEA9E4|nr:uncharacterized protein BDB00DRAFT_794463 [Zychaea mexicana]KAI9499555.1 hypothetical protein BDB00DRAFT_794463 [Zychaea mexicana]